MKETGEEARVWPETVASAPFGLAGPAWSRKFDGAETNFNVGSPRGTLIQGTVGYAIDGNIPRYDSRWSFDLMVDKPF